MAAVDGAFDVAVEALDEAPEPAGCGVAFSGVHWTLPAATATTVAAVATRVAVLTVNIRPPRRVVGVRRVDGAGKGKKRRARRRAISRRIVGRASGSTSIASARACNA